MESLKSGNELTNKIVEIQGTQIHSKGDSVPEIESINTFLTTISFAVEDLFNNTYEVLNNSLEQYIASDEAIGNYGNKYRTIMTKRTVRTHSRM